MPSGSDFRRGKFPLDMRSLHISLTAICLVLKLTAAFLPLGLILNRLTLSHIFIWFHLTTSFFFDVKPKRNPTGLLLGQGGVMLTFGL